jgi:hypothetical protein
VDGLALVHQARAAGLLVTVDGDTLVVEGPRRADSIARQLLAHKPEVVAALKAAWDDPLADALIQIATGRVSRSYDEAAPGCPVDGPGWDEAEALVAVAVSLRNLTALRDSLAAYEQHATKCFSAWADKTSELAVPDPEGHSND